MEDTKGDNSNGKEWGIHLVTTTSHSHLTSLLHARQEKSNGGEENMERKKHQHLAHPNKENMYIMYSIDTKNGENFDQGIKIQ